LRLGVYGGTFNPPHLGHIRAAESAARQLALDTLLVIPSGIPPHKALPSGSAGPEDRLEMARLSFSALDNTVISDIELKTSGISYTADTLDRLLKAYPGAETFLIMGSDMFLTLEQWRNAASLLELVRPAVLVRGTTADEGVSVYAEKLQREYGVGAVMIHNEAIEVSSSELRESLPKRGGFDMMEEETYAYIISKRLYGAKPDFGWLRKCALGRLKPSRILHVLGCENEAVKLAARYGADEDEAREAAILHDVTKALELDDQLQLCQKYDIMTDAVERSEVKLLHSKTGAAVARDIFGVSASVYHAILWHTTGRENMSLLEKVIYIADYIEPSRNFDGVEELRSLAYDDLDQAMIKGLRMSIEDMRLRGIVPHLRTQEAIAWMLEHTAEKGDKEKK
jgi:nicotinate-nucleotide adenylyltransferase